VRPPVPALDWLKTLPAAVVVHGMELVVAQQKRVRNLARRSSASGLGLMVALTAAAATAAPELGGEARISMGWGGESIATVVYDDGSKSDLNLGTYFTGSLGGSLTPFRAGVHAFDIEGLVGWASWSTGPENTEDRIKLSRFPLELLGFYRVQLPRFGPLELRLGGGGSYQLIGGAKGTGTLDHVSIDIGNALGWVGEVRAVWGVLGVGVRYTAAKYQVGGLSLDASSLGLVLGVVFPALPPPPAATP
jgi:hypothetical protein